MRTILISIFSSDGRWQNYLGECFGTRRLPSATKVIQKVAPYDDKLPEGKPLTMENSIVNNPDNNQLYRKKTGLCWDPKPWAHLFFRVDCYQECWLWLQRHLTNLTRYCIHIHTYMGIQHKGMSNDVTCVCVCGYCELISWTRPFWVK